MFFETENKWLFFDNSQSINKQSRPMMVNFHTVEDGFLHIW